MKTITHSPWARLGIVVFLVAILTFASVSTVRAAGYDDDGIIEKGETVNDDIYLNGNQVRIDGTVFGNVFITANNAVITGSVHGDVFAFGDTIVVTNTGVIDGNLIAGANTVQVSGKISNSLVGGSSSLVLNQGAEIGRNIYFGGFSLEADPQTDVGVDMYVAGYQLILGGTVNRDVNGAAAAIEVNGDIGRNATFNMGEAQYTFEYISIPPSIPSTISPGLRVSPDAKIGGDLKYTYSLNQSATINNQPGGKIIYKTPVPSQQSVPHPVSHIERQANFWGWLMGQFFLGTLKRFWVNLFSLILLGGLVVAFLPGLLKSSTTQLSLKPMVSFGYGLLVVISGYIALILAGLVILALSIIFTLISLGGLSTATFGLGFASLGFAGVVFTMLVIYASKLVVAYLVGRWILKGIAPQSRAAQMPFWCLVIGILVYAILRSLPFVGWIFALIVILFGLGAIWLAFLSWRNQRKAGDSVQESAE
jgi:cytoskeletal protein CcmA (bactofilin family)